MFGRDFCKEINSYLAKLKFMYFPLASFIWSSVLLKFNIGCLLWRYKVAHNESLFSFTFSVTQDIPQAGLRIWEVRIRPPLSSENGESLPSTGALEDKGARARSRESKLSPSLSQMQGALILLTLDLDLDGLVFAEELAPRNYYPVNNSLSIKTLKALALGVKETLVTE